MDKIKMFIAQIVMHKYLPVQYLVKGWTALTGYRSQIFAVLWVVVYELNKYHVSFLSDQELTKKLLEGLATGGAVTLIEKFKTWLPLVEGGVDEVKQGEIK